MTHASEPDFDEDLKKMQLFLALYKYIWRKCVICVCAFYVNLAATSLKVNFLDCYLDFSPVKMCLMCGMKMVLDFTRVELRWRHFVPQKKSIVFYFVSTNTGVTSVYTYLLLYVRLILILKINFIREL